MCADASVGVGVGVGVGMRGMDAVVDVVDGEDWIRL